MAWQDPILPRIKTPSAEELQKTPFRLGDATFYLLPKQYEFVYCRERFVAYTSGFGSGKTKAGIYRGTLLSMMPDNLGIVGRAASTDLELTTKRDFLDFLHEAKLLKKEPGRKAGAIVYCVDPKTNEPLGRTSEIQFRHMENPAHMRGGHVGWFWPDEKSEIPFQSWLELLGRNRLAHIPFRSGFATGNPNGHDWSYDYWYNPEKVQGLSEKDRRDRRGIHATSFENYYLPPQYLEDMKASFPEEWLKRLLMGDMDIFEGQVFKEFDHGTHCVESRWCANFKDGEPPNEWIRVLGIDVGGTDPWAFVFAAVDRYGNVVFYDEVYKPGVVVAEFADVVKPKLADRQFVAKVIDYENKLAAEELRRAGIVVTNARKRGKMESVAAMGGYLHPNIKRTYPDWHPKKGKPGSPGVFFTEKVPNLIRELGQQRWKADLQGHAMNVLDEKISNHAFDAALYVIRERPRPEQLPKSIQATFAENQVDARSAYYHLLEAEQEKYRKQRQSVTRIFLPFKKVSDYAGMPC